MAMTKTTLATKTITLDLPEELVTLLGPSENLPRRVLEALVLDLLREADISQGKAAHLLGLTRYDILDLMVLHKIPSGPATAKEMRQEIENARRYVRSSLTDGDSQQQ